MYSLKSPS